MVTGCPVSYKYLILFVLHPFGTSTALSTGYAQSYGLLTEDKRTYRVFQKNLKTQSCSVRFKSGSRSGIPASGNKNACEKGDLGVCYSVLLDGINKIILLSCLFDAKRILENMI